MEWNPRRILVALNFDVMHSHLERSNAFISIKNGWRQMWLGANSCCEPTLKQYPKHLVVLEVLCLLRVPQICITSPFAHVLGELREEWFFQCFPSNQCNEKQQLGIKKGSSMFLGFSDIDQKLIAQVLGPIEAELFPTLACQLNYTCRDGGDLEFSHHLAC